MSKKNKPEEIPSWIRDLYKEDLDRVVRGERPMYFRGMDDSPLRNVSPEFDILSGGAAVKGMNGIRGALSPLNNGMGNYNFSIRGINKKIGGLVDEAGLYLPEKLRPVYRTVVDAMSSSKDKGLGHITQPLANALYPADERRNRRLDGEYPVGYVDAIDGIWPMEKYGLWGEKIERKADGGEMYTVSKGDTLWSIAKRLGLSLDDIISWNRDIPDINKIQIGDKIKVSDPSLSIEKEDHDLMDIISREAEINKMSDEDIIKSVDHKSNYAIVDKKNKKLTVYSPSGDILYSTNNIGVGASGDDYNTYTKTTKDKKLIAGAGNMSTPAGITRVSGIGEYHGQKSFQRARFDPKTGKWDHDISSSMHHEASAGRGSNGCIRLLGNTGNELYNFIKKGDFIYTLPEKEGSRFVVRGFKDNKGNDIDKFDALLYKWMGKGRLLNNGKASPDDNDYINNVKKYIGNFDFKVKYKDGGPIGDDPLYVRQDVSDKASYLKDILGNAIRRRLYENVTPDVVASNASLPDKVNEFIYGRNGKANVDEYSDQLWARFLSQPNNLDGNNKEIRIPDNVITDIEKMFNRDTKDEIKRLDKKIHDTEQEIYGSDKPATDDAYGRLKLLKKSREWVDVFEKNRNSVRSGKPTVFSEYDFYPEAAGDLTPLSGFGNFTIYRRPDGRLGVYDVYDFHGDDQEFPVNVATNVLDAIGDKFEERGSFEDRNPLLESGKDALIRNAIMSKNKLEDKEDGGPVNTEWDYGAGKYVIDPSRSEDSKMVVYDEIWDYLTEKKGIPQTQAIGILSNIAAESGGDTEALGAAGDFGIQQWLGPRKKELQRRYGKKPTLTQQLDYLVDEYQGKVPGLGWNYINQGKFFDKDAQGNVYNYYMYSKSDFDNAVNYKDATVAWNQGYGRPLGSTLRNEKRFEFADMFANRYGVPENEPMRYEFGQRDSGTGDGGQQPVPETVAPADPSLASRPSMDIWWEKEGQDLLYKMLAQSGANKKAIEDIANNIKNDPQSEAQIAEAERMRKEQAKRQLVLNMIPGLMLNIKGMSSIKFEGGPVGDDKWFYDKDQRKRIVDK